MTLDHIGTQFLGGDLYMGATYTQVYTVCGIRIHSNCALRTNANSYTLCLGIKNAPTLKR